MSKFARCIVIVTMTLGALASALPAQASNIVYGCIAYVNTPRHVSEAVGIIYEARGSALCDRPWGAIITDVELIASNFPDFQYIAVAQESGACYSCQYVPDALPRGTCLGAATYFKTLNEVTAVAPSGGGVGYLNARPSAVSGQAFSWCYYHAHPW